MLVVLVGNQHAAAATAEVGQTAAAQLTKHHAAAVARFLRRAPPLPRASF